MYKHFNEDTRVKFPATIHFLRLGYEYQSLKDAQIDFETKIFMNRFKSALEKINGRKIDDSEIFQLKIFCLIFEVKWFWLFKYCVFVKWAKPPSA